MVDKFHIPALNVGTREELRRIFPTKVEYFDRKNFLAFLQEEEDEA